MRMIFLGVTSAVLVGAWAAPARAHFELQAPAAYSEQDASGSPQKSPPCGQEDTNDPMVATNAVTTLMEGSLLTVTIAEKVTHPGHYRVSLAADQASLPADPAVTPGATECGSAAIEDPAALPVIADNLFPHTSAFTAPQTAMVQLPAGFTCTGCVVQVVEFMSDHPLNAQGGCFYHHCAIVNIAATAPDAGAGATAPDAGSGSGATPPRSSGGGCAAEGSLASGGLLVLVAGTVLARRRRRA